ncbi:MAG: endonuclease/exonuclease/phosphatase family protein [Acetobacteraceae bacterium]|nr:endonuclease/exonuclease/phosphatase family protein [Acetobacteraceae bacterium]
MRALFLALALFLHALPAAAAEIKLATWNIAWLTLRAPADPALPRGLTPRTPADFDALARYARQLDADVVALQEVDGPQAAARIFDPATHAFFFAREDDVQRTGFAVRRTLRAVQNEDLDRLDTRAGARRSLRRGTDITVGEGTARLRLLSIHLNAGCMSGPLDRADAECETLHRQAEILAGWVAARRREGMAFAILGDFNRRFIPNDGFLRALAGPETPLGRATEGHSNPCWSDARGGRPFIDHILLGGDAERWMQATSLRVLVYAERDAAMRERLSDHCPVSIRLRLPG